MSTKKITALTELSAAPAATDMIPVVDVSDTTDAASGTTKKITATNIAKGVGIGAGNTTSEPIKIDTTNGRMGIRNNAPGVLLALGGGGVQGNATFFSGMVQVSNGGTAAGVGIFSPGANVLGFTTDSTERMRIDSAGKVGIGTTAPAAILETSDSVNGEFVGLQISNFRTAVSSDTGDQASIKFMFKNESSTLQPAGKIWSQKIGDYEGGGAAQNSALDFYTALSGTNTFAMRIDESGNVLIGGTAKPTSSVGNLCLFNGTAPAASVTNGVVLYAQDVSTSELKVRDEAGNIATLSPHNFDLLGDRSEEMAWSYSCKNAFAGKEVAVDMTKVIRALEKLTGEEYIKIRDIADSEKLDWDEEEKRKEAERKVEVDAYKARKVRGDKEKADFDKKWGTLPTGSNTKAEIKAFLDDGKIEYEDATKEELLKKVPEKPEFTEVEITTYTKKPKPDWLK